MVTLSGHSEPEQFVMYDFQEWTREEKNKCLEETENSFKYSGKILREIISQ